MHALFHLILTFSIKTDFRNPSQGVCPCPNLLFLLVHFMLRFEQFEQFFLLLMGFAFLIRWMCELIWVAIGFFLLGYVLAWYVHLHKQQCCLSCTGTWASANSKGNKDERKIYCSCSTVHRNPYQALHENKII